MTRFNLSEAEYEIMEFIWEHDCKMRFSEIMEFTGKQGHEWKKQTVQTYLTRLIEKRALKAEKEGNCRYYYPAMSRQEYISVWTKRFIKESFENSLTEFLSAFTGGKSLTEEEAKELHDFLDE